MWKLVFMHKDERVFVLSIILSYNHNKIIWIIEKIKLQRIKIFANIL